MKNQVTQAQVVATVVETGISGTDLPGIRTALNDTMDYYERTGELSRRRSDTWSQDRMVKAVQRQLRYAKK